MTSPEHSSRATAEGELTPELLAELERRRVDALSHPDRCRPAAEVLAAIEAGLLIP